MDEHSGRGEVIRQRGGSCESCADDPSEGDHFDVLVVLRDQRRLGLDD